MAKKKGKKNQKQVDWTSPPPSPKPATEEPLPTLPGAIPLSPETVSTDDTADDSVESISSPTTLKAEEPPSEEPTAELMTQESTSVEGTDATDQQDESDTSLKEDDDRIEPAPAPEAPTESHPQEELEENSTSDRVRVPGSGSAPEAPPTPKPTEPPKAEESKATEEVAPEPSAAVETEATAKVDDTPAKEPSAEAAPEAAPPSTSADTPDEPKAAEVADQPASESSDSQSSAETTEDSLAASSPPTPEPSAFPEPKDQAPEAPPHTKSPPKPAAIKQVIEGNRPPAAPTPPPNKARPRHSFPLENDEEEEEPLTRPRTRGDISRDPSRALSYPPQPQHSRGVFASRVPVEHYSTPPHPPPGYHPRYYSHTPPTAPPYYHSHSHSMSQSGGYPNPGPYGGPPSHASSPYQEAWGQYPPSFPPYGTPPMQRHDSVGSRDFPMGPPSIENSSAVEDDTVDIFSRISQAIPDLHMLLARYKETHGQLGVREELLRRAGIEQQEKLKSKDNEIKHLKDRVDTLENKHSGEASRLRLEIGNMEEQMKELREQIAETEKYKKEAEETRLALDAAKTSWEAKYKELEATNANLEITTVVEKEKAQQEFEEWKSTTTTKHDAEKIALAIQFDKKLKEADVIAENQRQEATAAFIKEKDELRSEHQRQQRERESNFDKVRKELETKLSTAQKDREEALKQERESREVWESERETLIKAHQEDRDSLQRGWDEQRELMETQYKKIKEESDKAWIELHAEANKKAEEEKAKVEQLTKEKDELQRKFDDLKTEHEKEKEVIKSVAGNLEIEKARLEKLVECYGDVTEIKSKGDTYYLVSFSQLSKQIQDLAETHFVHLPVTPPPDVLANIPPELPSFLGDTIASRQLRAAYIAHTVSKMITFRVFGPFLFSLGRRYDKADSLFLSMSNHIRDKSTRKEAIWRQQTLLAAFTSSGAKQRINTAAGTVVDEIVTAIKYFADPKEEEAIRIAVRRIVKLAAETWRFARLEREMIVATMPAVQDEEHGFTGPEYWPAHKLGESDIQSLAGTVVESDNQPKLLLRLFPVIQREPMHECFRSSEDEKPDEGFVYHHGLALYDNAPSVVTREEELKQAGLPPVTHTSPTATDFPPPVIPPPRNPPPPTPDAAEENPAEENPTEEPREQSSPPPSPPPTIPYLRNPPPLSPKVPEEEARQPSPPPPPPTASPPPLSTASPPPLPPESPPPPPTVSPPPPPTEASGPASPPPVPSPTESAILRPPPPPPAPTESAILPPPLPPPAPTESAILPPPQSIPTPTPASSTGDMESQAGERGLPTPPRSRAGTPPSPLFAAMDEIDGLKQHSSRNPSLSRRSTGLGSSRNSNEELRKDRGESTSRRTSGYAISNRSSIDGASQKSTSSRYWSESRSAAIKGLYPSSPMAGCPPMERTTSAPTRTNSLRSQKVRVSRSPAQSGREDSATWNFDIIPPPSTEGSGPS